MIAYEVTVEVDEVLAERFIAYMRGHHIPRILATGCFAHAELDRSLAGQRAYLGTHLHVDAPAGYHRGHEGKADAVLLEFDGNLIVLLRHRNRTISSGARTGNCGNATEAYIVNTTVLMPMPRASVATAIAVNPGVLASLRRI